MQNDRVNNQKNYELEDEQDDDELSADLSDESVELDVGVEAEYLP